MHKSSVIVSTIAAGGVLVAASVAGVSVMNAASASTTGSSSPSVVADVGQEPISAAVSPEPANAMATVGASSLPALPSLSSTPAQSRHTTAAKQPGQQASTAGSSGISAKQATASVLSSASGRVLAVSKASRGGYHAWSVRVERTDGSVVTGYVDRKSGTVFDWVINQNAPAAPHTTHGNGGGGRPDGDDDDQDDEHQAGIDVEHEGDDD